MGIEIEINNLEDMCDLMCYNKLPRKKVNKVGEWIPVTEKLPNDGEEVLFCDLFGDVMLGYHPKDWKRTHFAERGSWELQKNVVAWMPLPKPYIAESEK